LRKSARISEEIGGHLRSQNVEAVCESCTTVTAPAGYSSRVLGGYGADSYYGLEAFACYGLVDRSVTVERSEASLVELHFVSFGFAEGRGGRT
jgi:hypothetical protein